MRLHDLGHVSADRRDRTLRSTRNRQPVIKNVGDMPEAFRPQPFGKAQRQIVLLGAVAPGFYADIIAVEGDPLTDITAISNRENIRWVMKAGRVVVDKTRSAEKAK